MMRPLVLLRYTLWAISVAIVAVHAVGFGVLMNFMGVHDGVLHHVTAAGENMQARTPDAMAHRCVRHSCRA